MTGWDFAHQHPWWALVGLFLVMACVRDMALALAASLGRRHNPDDRAPRDAEAVGR